MQNTLAVAEKCNLLLEFDKLRFPTYQPPDGFTREQYLRHLCQQGLRARYNIEWKNPKDPREKSIVDRIEFELKIMEKTGFVSYFLIVWDFVHFARSSGIPVGPGRGNAAGSVVAYLLRITDIDPLRYNLLFERFLNPERISPPDIDMDFCYNRRAEVIEYVRKKYGDDHVAQIITFGTLGAKMVVRDVGRVMGLSYGECDRIAKMIPPDIGMTLKKALEINPELKGAYQNEPAVRRVIDTGFTLEGISRNASTHAAGVVIGAEPLTNIVPLTTGTNSNEIVTQYSMDPLGHLGLLKMDFLGLKTLTVIKDALDLAEQTTGQRLDVDKIPMQDKKTFDLLAKANTIGVFQLESQGMRDLCRRIGVDSIDVIIALIALFRPGPMNMLDDYVNRKHGKVKVAYDHPLLEPILKETFGVFVYQEQVMQAANALAGYSLGGADVLRRAMGKKKPEEMEKQREIFLKGCHEKNRIPRAKANQIFDTLAKFAGYGFNKSHSAAYAIVAYQTAWLKANYPVEYMAALLSNEFANTDKIQLFINECKRMGIEVLAPDVNESGLRFTVRDRPDSFWPGGHQERWRNRRAERNPGARGERPIPIFRGLLHAGRPADREPKGAGVPREMRRVRFPGRTPDTGVRRHRTPNEPRIQRPARPRTRAGRPVRRGAGERPTKSHGSASRRGLVAERDARIREGVARVLRDGPSVERVCRGLATLRSRLVGKTGATSGRAGDAHRRDRQQIDSEDDEAGPTDGDHDAGRPRWLGGSVGLPRIVREVRAESESRRRDLRLRDGQLARRQTEDRGRSDHRARGCAEEIYQGGAHSALGGDHGGFRARSRSRSGAGPQREHPGLVLLYLSRR